jgi:hypothetical protein
VEQIISLLCQILGHAVSAFLEMQHIFATAVILCFFAAITAFSFFATHALFLTFFSISFAHFFIQ